MFEINYLAILVSGVVAMIVGGLWYGPLFGKQWMTLMGMNCDPASITPEQKKQMYKSYAFMFVGSLVMAFVFSTTLAAFGAVGASMALQGAFWTWLGFFVPVLMGSVLWEMKPWKLFFINAGHYLISLAITALILTLWQ
ncbi:MAG: DUF1761 domain-containing protein [Candidatus Pacebacteria bacterium]|nr:DUF1761 domain-containing protein [Candidatus Paceibacterota bacterium]